jgi:hypothetical protein
MSVSARSPGVTHFAAPEAQPKYQTYERRIALRQRQQVVFEVAGNRNIHPPEGISF